MLIVLLGCHRGPAHCAVCDREECRAVAFRMAMPGGKKVETCCARCGLHFLGENSAASKAEATDFSTGHWMDATKAFYVHGSEVHPCATMSTQRDAHGCCVFKSYDRCQPSTIAFATRPAAAEFAQRHGGDIQTFPELLRAVQPPVPPK